MVNKSDINDKLEVSRAELARLARNKKTRVLGWPSLPCDWRPMSVENPASGMTFTDAGAWAFIADLLSKGVLIEVIELDKPPGLEAYVIKHVIDENKPELYIKIHFGNGRVVGRSFHYSEKKTRDS